jgi:hypothetical protein
MGWGEVLPRMQGRRSDWQPIMPCPTHGGWVENGRSGLRLRQHLGDLEFPALLIKLPAGNELNVTESNRITTLCRSFSNPPDSVYFGGELD